MSDASGSIEGISPKDIEETRKAKWPSATTTSSDVLQRNSRGRNAMQGPAAPVTPTETKPIEDTSKSSEQK